MRIKITLFVLILFGVLASEEAVAQRVCVKDGYAVIDCSGLPEGAVKNPQELIDSKTTDGRVRRHLQGLDEPRGSLISGIHGDYYANQKVSRKFAVASENLPGTMTWAVASGWNTAANNNLDADTDIANTGCAAYRGKDQADLVGTWRLPTQREIMIIYANKGQLEKTRESGFGDTDFIAFSRIDCWSATEHNSTTSWSVGFYNGSVNVYYTKDNSHYVRCVRDLDGYNTLPDVYTDSEGRTVVDASLMNPNTFTKVPKAKTTSATNETTAPNTWDHLSSAVSDEKVYYKFEVRKENLSNSSWKKAIDACSNLQDDGGSWRMPTSKEIKMMYSLKLRLEAQPTFPEFGEKPYWTATEIDARASRFLYFQTGRNGNNPKINANNVRCIREL